MTTTKVERTCGWPLRDPNEHIYSETTDGQVGGDHYSSLKIQPFDLVEQRYGRKGLEASLFTKVMKYMMRDKGSKLEDWKKARHCLDIMIENYVEEEIPF